MQVLVISQGHQVPSTLYRTARYCDYLRNNSIKHLHYIADSYPSRNTLVSRTIWLFTNIYHQIAILCLSFFSTHVILQRQVTSGILLVEFLYAHKCFLDIDDACFFTSFLGTRTYREFQTRALEVWCGSPKIQEFFDSKDNNLLLFPTTVDFSSRLPCVEPPKQLRIGWIGTYPNFYNLNSLLTHILDFCSSTNSKLYICSSIDVYHDYLSTNPTLMDLVSFVLWTPESSKDFFSDLDVGLMPLERNQWNSYKCAFKLLQYISHGVLPLASPVGVNCDILSLNSIFLASTPDDWKASLQTFLYSWESCRSEFLDLRSRTLQNYETQTVLEKNLSFLLP